MKYMGSKNKIAKYIVPIIERYIVDNGVKNYVEPFVGGANVIDKVRCENKIGADANEYLIALYQNKEKVLKMPYVTKELYTDVKLAYKNKDYSVYDKWFIGAVGFFASYNGKFFEGGYSGKRTIKNGATRDYYDEALRNFIAQIPNLENIKFLSGEYDRVCSVIHNSLIYCDPPYKDTTQYGTSANFDSEKFWDWCREMAEDNIVLVSEQTAPSDIRCIWEQEVARTLDCNSSKKITEKLYLVNKN